MDKQAIIDKIRKCLALSESSNEHEAAAAMRQARKLMEKHGLNEVGADFFTTKEQEIKNDYKNAPVWYCMLGQVVGKAFGCVFYHTYKKVIFVGDGAAAEIAGYSFDVVLRLLTAKKGEFLKTRSVKWASAAKKRELGQSYCEGFVIGVNGVVKEFAGKIPEETATRYSEYLALATQKKVTDTKERKSKLDSGSEAAMYAACAGAKAGKEVKLSHGVGADAGPLTLGFDGEVKA